MINTYKQWKETKDLLEEMKTEVSVLRDKLANVPDHLRSKYESIERTEQELNRRPIFRVVE